MTGRIIILELVGNHAVEEPTDNNEIGLRGFDFNFLDEYGKGIGKEGSSEFPYLIMLIKLWPVECKN